MLLLALKIQASDTVVDLRQTNPSPVVRVSRGRRAALSLGTRSELTLDPKIEEVVFRHVSPENKEHLKDLIESVQAMYCDDPILEILMFLEEIKTPNFIIEILENLTAQHPTNKSSTMQNFLEALKSPGYGTKNALNFLRQIPEITISLNNLTNIITMINDPLYSDPVLFNIMAELYLCQDTVSTHAIKKIIQLKSSKNRLKEIANLFPFDVEKTYKIHILINELCYQDIPSHFENISFEMLSIIHCLKKLTLHKISEEGMEDTFKKYHWSVRHFILEIALHTIVTNGKNLISLTEEMPSSRDYVLTSEQIYELTPDYMNFVKLALLLLNVKTNHVNFTEQDFIEIALQLLKEKPFSRSEVALLASSFQYVQRQNREELVQLMRKLLAQKKSSHPIHPFHIRAILLELNSNSESEERQKIVADCSSFLEKFKWDIDANTAFSMKALKVKSNLTAEEWKALEGFSKFDISPYVFYQITQQVIDRLPSENRKKIIDLTDKLISSVHPEELNEIDITNIIRLLSLHTLKESENIVNQISTQIAKSPTVITSTDINTMLRERGEEGYFKRKEIISETVNLHMQTSQLRMHIWKELTSGINPRLIPSLENCLETIHTWIENLSDDSLPLFLFDLAEDAQTQLTVEKVKEHLKNFLKSENFKNALDSSWNDLAQAPKGEDLLRYVVFYIQRKELDPLTFVVQALWESITSFGNEIGSISCYTGIAERFLMCLRKSTINFEALIAEHKDLRLFFETKYNDPRENPRDFIRRQQEKLKALRYSIEEELKKRYPKQREDIQKAFESPYVDEIFDPADLASHFNITEQVKKEWAQKAR